MAAPTEQPRAINVSALSGGRGLSQGEVKARKEANDAKYRRTKVQFGEELDRLDEVDNAIFNLYDLLVRAGKGNYINVYDDSGAANPINRNLIRSARILYRAQRRSLQEMFNVSIKRRVAPRAANQYAGNDAPSVLGPAAVAFLNDPDGAKFGGVNSVQPVGPSNPPLVSQLGGLVKSGAKILSHNTYSRLFFIYLARHPAEVKGGGFNTMEVAGSAVAAAFRDRNPTTPNPTSYVSWDEPTGRSVTKTRRDGTQGAPVPHMAGKSYSYTLLQLGLARAPDAFYLNGALRPMTVVQMLQRRGVVNPLKDFDTSAYKLDRVAMMLTNSSATRNKLIEERDEIDTYLRRNPNIPAEQRAQLTAHANELDANAAELNTDESASGVMAVRQGVQADSAKVLAAALAIKSTPEYKQQEQIKDAQSEARKRAHDTALEQAFRQAWATDPRVSGQPIPPVSGWRSNLKANYRLFLESHGLPAGAVTIVDPAGVAHSILAPGGVPGRSPPFDVLNGGYQPPTPAQVDAARAAGQAYRMTHAAPTSGRVQAQ